LRYPSFKVKRGGLDAPAAGKASDGICNNKTLIAFKNVEGRIDEVVGQFEQSGFVVQNLYRLPNRKYVVTAHISSKLLLMMTCLYANDLPNTKTADMMLLPFHMRMSEKAVMTLPEAFMKGVSYQIISDVPAELAEALKTGKVGPVTENLHKYFGSQVAITLSWLRFGNQCIYPGFFLWLLMILSQEWEYAPLVGTFTSCLFSFSVGYWKVGIDLDLDKYSYCRSYKVEDAVNLTGSQPGLGSTISIPRILLSVGAVLAVGMTQLALVWILDTAHVSNVAIATLTQVFYYFIAMSVAIVVQYKVLPKLSEWEALPTMKARHASEMIKQFVVKIGVFLWSAVSVVVSGGHLNAAQVPMTFLMLCHCFFHDRLLRFWRKHLKLVNFNEVHATRRPITFTEEDADKVQLFVLDAVGVPIQVKEGVDKHHASVLVDCAKTSFPVHNILMDSIVIFGAMLLIARISPAAIAICMVQIWRLMIKFQHKLIHRRQYPVVSEDPSMEPFLSIIEIFSIVAMAWNIGTLFMVGVDFQAQEAASRAAEMPGDVVDNLVWRLFSSLNSAFNMTNSSVSLIIWCVVCEHVVVFLRCVLFPFATYVNYSSVLAAQRALFSIAESNENTSTVLYRAGLLAKSLFEKSVAVENSEGWKQQYRLAKTRSNDDSSMSPIFYAALAMIPFCCSNFFKIPWHYTTIPLTLFCGYQHRKIKRQKRAVALAIVSDPDVFDIVAKNEFPQFAYSSETDRSAWCNKMFELTWPALKEFACNTIKNVADVELERAKPSFASFLRLTKLSMGNSPPYFLSGGIRVLDPVAGKDMVELEVDIVWNSDMEMAISLGMAGQEVTLNMTKLRFSGTCRVQCLPLIPFIPPFAWGKVTFFKKPFIDFNLSLGDAELLEGSTSSSFVMDKMRNVLRDLLEKMGLYPNWINVPMVGRVERFIKFPPDYYLNTPPVGILSIKIVKCNNLIVGDITTSDPYVKITIRDEEFMTDVMYKTLNPEWNDAEFWFLIYDKNMEHVHVEVWDKDLGSIGSFLGRTDVWFPNIEDGGSQRLVLNLQGVSSGTITLELGFNEIVNSSFARAETNPDAIMDFKALFDTMVADDCKELANMINITEGNQAAGHNVTCMDNGSASFKEFSSSSSSFAHDRRNRRTGIPGSPTVPRVAGVLTISGVGFSEVKSVKTMLSNTQYFSPFITFMMGGTIKKQTIPASTKKSSATFSAPFTFVVNSTTDVIRIKLKYATHMSHVTLYEWTNSVEEIIRKSKEGHDGKFAVKESIYEGLKLAVGDIFFKLDFRATVAHMRHESDARLLKRASIVF
jgi:hypothetical protein